MRISMRRAVCAAAVICFMGALSAAAASRTTIGHLTIEVGGRESYGSHGYAPHRIRIHNRSPVKTHRIKISLEQPRRSGSGDGRLKSVSKTIQVAPNSTAVTYMHQPHLRFIGDLHGAAVWVDGKKWGGSGGFSGYDHGWKYRVAKHAPAHTIEATGATVAIDGDAMSGISYGEPDLFPRDLIALEPILFNYSGLDGIHMTLFEAEELSAGKRDAIWEYIKSGGSLAVIGEGKLPDEWKRLDKRLGEPRPQKRRGGSL